jgi:hypothetical protein
VDDEVICMFFLPSSLLYLVYLHLLLSRATFHPVSSRVWMTSNERGGRGPGRRHTVCFLVFLSSSWSFGNRSQVAYLSYVMIIEGKFQIVIGIGIDAYWMFIYN